MVMKENVKESLIHICKNLLEWDVKRDWDKLSNMQFFGSEIDMEVNDLLYLFFEIENYFGIKVPEEFIVNEKFVNLSNIVNLICDHKKETHSGV